MPFGFTLVGVSFYNYVYGPNEGFLCHSPSPEKCFLYVIDKDVVTQFVNATNLDRCKSLLPLHESSFPTTENLHLLCFDS